MPGATRRKFFFPRYGVAHSCAQEPTPGSAVKFRGKSVRKNRPMVPRSNIAGSWTGGGGAVHCTCIIVEQCMHCGMPSNTIVELFVKNSYPSLFPLLLSHKKLVK